MTIHQVLRWEEPRPQDRGPEVGKLRKPEGVWAAVADQLRGRPGEWAVIFEGTAGRASALAYYVRAGMYGFGPAGTFGAATRTKRPYRPGAPKQHMTILYAQYRGGVPGCWPDEGGGT